MSRARPVQQSGKAGLCAGGMGWVTGLRFGPEDIAMIPVVLRAGASFF